MILELLKAVSILLALSLLQGFIVRFWHNKPAAEQVLSGLLFGGICVVGMMVPIEITPGVIFDPRSVILSMAGLFGGVLVAVISGVIAGAYRIWIGGGGVYVGVAVVIACSSMGLLYRHARDKGLVKIGPWQLLLFGLIVHVIEVLLFSQLPAAVVARVMDTVALPLILTFTPATAILGMLLIDVENRFNIESALRDSEAKLSRHLQNTPLGVISLDRNFRCIQWNMAAEKIFGYSADEVLGQDLSKLTVPQQAQSRVAEVFGLLLDQKGGTRNINENETRDGRIITCEWYNTPIVDERGNTIGISSMCEDITEQERIRHDQKILTGELESKNAELERFVYTVSHDLRSPLVTIKGFVGLLEKDIDENDIDRVKTDLENIDKATDTMGELLSGLLELSRIGRIINPPESGSLDDLIARSVDNVREKIGELGIEIAISKNMPPYWGDQLRLLEVFQNLIENAIKFMGDQSSPRIEIGAWTEDAGIVCEIRDNGMGINPEYHDRIFNLFERLNPQIDGTGIGMSLVKRIIEAHGGSIRVESEGDQKGCRFTIRLPGRPNDDSDQPMLVANQ